MSNSVSTDVDQPGPARVRTRQDFARELTLLRERADLTVRQVAGRVGVQGAHSTIGDWFAGRGLPSASSGDLLVRVLRVCGVVDSDLVEQWLHAWRRVRRAPGRRSVGPEPYRGLASYQPEDADWFFGREALTGQLIARLADLHVAGGGLQVVVGASGSGKSSLLRAGMVPALRADALPGSAHWPVLLFTPGSHPLDELAEQLAGITGAAAESTPPRRWVLVVDQFEEVFVACAEAEERRQFIDALCAAAGGPDGALVVLGLRADFYAQVLRYPQLVTAVQAGQLAVGPMSEEELRKAIVRPAQQAKIDIETGLADLLLREVAPRSGGTGTGAHDAGVLPLLSHALYATWCQGRNRRMTIADYREVGGIDGAVAASAAKVYDELTAPQQELARRLFLSLVHVAADTADTRRRVPTAELFAEHDDAGVAELEDVLDRFVAQRLVTADVDTVEISHEALLAAWPRLRAWLEADRAGLVVGRRLTEAAVTWRREHQDPAALYRGTRLAAAQEWVETSGHRVNLTPPVREFLDTSVRHELAEQRAVRRRARRLRQLVAGLLVMLLCTVVATAVTVRSLRATRAERNIAVSGKVANEATALRTTNPALAGQLSLAAYRLAPTPEAAGSLLSTAANPYFTRLTGHTSAVYAAVFGPDGRTLVTASSDHSARLWEVGDSHHPVPVATLVGHTDQVYAAAFSPDGHIVATGGADRTVRLWEVGEPREARAVATLTGHTGDVRRVAFSPDGRTLVTASADRTVRLWDVGDPGVAGPLAVLTGHREGVAAAVFSPDGRTVASVGSDRPVRLWDVSDRRRPEPLPVLTGHTDRVLSAAFSPDGRTLATGSFDNTLRLWDVGDVRHPGPLAALTGHENGVVSVAFGPDGHTVATGSYDQTVRLWDIADPHFASAPVTLSGHGETVYSVSFSPDGRTLASASRDATARLWDVRGPVLTGHAGPVHSAVFSPDGRVLVANAYRTSRLWDVGDPRSPRPLATLTGHTDNVVMAAISQDGRVLATASLDRTVRLWDLTDPGAPTPLATLPPDTDNVFAVALSPDGRTLVTAGATRAVRLWDVTDPRRPHRLAVLTGHTDRVFTVVFSPDGRTVASSSADRTVRLWDVADPRLPAPLATLDGHGNGVNSVAFSPDGRALATASFDHTARLWDVADLRRPSLTTTLTGHANGVNSVTFSPDGRTLATAGFDSTVRIWDVVDRHRPGPPVVLTGHTDRVNSVRFAPNGRTIATGSADATARLWDIDIDRIGDRVCAFADLPVDRPQWRQYFPDLAYRPPCP
ncbi:helix-turn-helix domain-containing protein [Plantactinospora solaniradicis]|uniref:Helix-turn-helix domain-containing protein n=1 Tax=Plantactinospora solaniradicis TaxID=1723736 RepID=A0ABW1KQN1_9ACTN